MEVSGQLNAPAALPQGKKPRYPLDRRLGGAQSRSGRLKSLHFKTNPYLKELLVISKAGTDCHGNQKRLQMLCKRDGSSCHSVSPQ
jgi:hypothetical protein